MDQSKRQKPPHVRMAIELGDTVVLKEMGRKGGIAAAKKRKEAARHKKEVAEISKVSVNREFRKIKQKLGPEERLPPYLQKSLTNTQAIEFANRAIENNEHICPIN